MEKLRIYNSRTRKKEICNPDSKQVGLYVCGITPYDVTHLGHAFTYTFFDVLIRYVRFLGHKATYVQNVTDIDDDILKKAREEKKNWRTLGEENTQQFLQDMRWLGNAQPSFYIRATDHISEMQTIIQKLLQKKFAYKKNGNVYFEVSKSKHYGKLSRLSASRMLPIANERGNNPTDTNKKHPLDFVLWQTKKPNEPSWDSPWGQGRPGWHIECSAMSTKYLGQPFTIHGGGEDLLFPHHESEIAQSEHAYGKPMAQFWMHTAMLKYQGEKMSKSLGNLVCIEDLQKIYNSNTVRIMLLSHHYRSVWEYTEKDIQHAEKLNRVLQRTWSVQSKNEKQLSFTKEQTAFFKALNDDLNTPKALSILEKLAQKITNPPNGGQNVTDAKAFCMQAFAILGLTIDFS